MNAFTDKNCSANDGQRQEYAMGSGNIDIAQAFEETPPPLDFVLPGLLAGTVGAIVSPGGAGKSMLALELMVLVSTGHDISGFNCGVTHHTGKVAFLAAEDPALAIRHRLHALGRHLNPALREQVAYECRIESLLGAKIDINSPEWLTLVQAVATGKRLLVLDTLRRFHGADENDSGQMAQLIGALGGVAERSGCAIVFLHHVSKSAALNGVGDMQQAGRGSSVLVDNIRWQAFLVGCSKEDAKKLEIDESMRHSFVRAGVSKQNYAKRADEMWLRRTEGGVLVPAEFATSSVTAKKTKKSKDKVNDDEDF